MWNTYSDDDRSAALFHAKQHGVSSRDDETSIFNHAFDFLGGNKASIVEQNDIDEKAALRAYVAVYGGGASGQKHSSETLGAGAALQALKIYMEGSAGEEGSHGAGGNSQVQLIGIAMGQASKLWEEQNGKGNVVSIESFFYRVLLFLWFALYYSTLYNLLIYFNSSLRSFLKSPFQISMFFSPFRSRPLSFLFRPYLLFPPWFPSPSSSISLSFSSFLPPLFPPQSLLSHLPLPS